MIMRKKSLLRVLSLLFFPLCLLACAGLKEVPESEKRYVEGVIVEGGVFGVRIMDENEKVFRFITRKGVEYQPDDFHAYVGDKVGVTYYAEMKNGTERYMALALKVVAPDPNRVPIGSGMVYGIVRAAGMRRYLVHLPKSGLTVAFYPDEAVRFSPKGWRPKPGAEVSVFYTEETKRFYKKFLFNRFSRMTPDPQNIADRVRTGVVTEILTQRDIHQRPDRFAFQLDNGDRVNLYLGGETIMIPADLKIVPGNAYRVIYYPLLMGDQSLRHVVTQISQ